MLTIRIGNVWAHSIAGEGGVGDIEVSHTYSADGSGLNYVKWAMDLPPNYWNPVFREGTMVEVCRGDQSLGSATISDVDRTKWTFVADGLHRRGERFFGERLVGTGPPSTTEAITNANAAGLGWNGFGNLPTDFFWEDKSKSIADHLREYCRANSLVWGLRTDRTPFVEAPPYIGDVLQDSSPKWALRPGVPLMPYTDGNYYKRVHILYYGGPETSVYGVPSTYLRASSNTPSDPDITPEGGVEVTLIDGRSISGGQAVDQANEIQRRYALRYTFTEGLEIFPGELMTPGGTEIDKWAAPLLCLGRMGVHYGAISTRNNSAVGETVQWVMGQTTYWPETDRLVVASMDSEPRDLKSLLSSNWKYDRGASRLGRPFS